MKIIFNEGNDTDYFDGVESSLTPREIFRINFIFNPRPVRQNDSNWPESEEGEVSIRHVVVLSAK